MTRNCRTQTGFQRWLVTERSYMQSCHFIINKEHPLSQRQRPEELVEPNVEFAPGTKGEKRLLCREAARQLECMFRQAKEMGIHLVGVSGYRSYERQKEIYDESVRTRGKEYTKKYIAPPGASEHQSGLAMDVSCISVNYQLEEAFSGTPEGVWLKKNAWLFGYIIRYPRGKEKITGYSYEPWHIRYVTRELSHYLSRFDMTLEEGLSSLDIRPWMT